MTNDDDIWACNMVDEVAKGMANAFGIEADAMSEEQVEQVVQAHAEALFDSLGPALRELASVAVGYSETLIKSSMYGIAAMSVMVVEDGHDTSGNPVDTYPWALKHGPEADGPSDFPLDERDVEAFRLAEASMLSTLAAAREGFASKGIDIQAPPWTIVRNFT